MPLAGGSTSASWVNEVPPKGQNLHPHQGVLWRFVLVRYCHVISVTVLLLDESAELLQGHLDLLPSRQEGLAATASTDKYATAPKVRFSKEQVFAHY